MKRRATKKAKAKPTKRKSVRKKNRKVTVKTGSNKSYHWAAYRQLQKRVDQAWAKLQSDVKKKAKPHILIEDKKHLMLLLGECNYMARECMRFASKGNK